VRKLVEEEFTYLKRIFFVREGRFVNDVISPPQSPEINPLPLAIDDIDERDDSLSVIQVEPTRVEAHPHTQVCLEKLNDLHNELGRDYFATDKMKNIGLEHVEHAIRRLNDLKRELQFAFNP
jgi:hypothetical protein